MAACVEMTRGVAIEGGNLDSKIGVKNAERERLGNLTTQKRLIFQLCFIMIKMKLYLFRNLCENFRQIGQKVKKL